MHVFCFLEGEPRREVKWPSIMKCCSWFSFLPLLFFSLVNLASLTFNIISICFSPSPCSDNYKFFIVSEEDAKHFIHNDNLTLAKYHNLNKMALTLSTVAAFLSYFTITYMVLLPLHSMYREKCYGKRCKKECCQFLCKALCSKIRNGCESRVLLSPFRDDGSVYSTDLNSVQCFYFYIFYFLHFLLFFANLGVLLAVLSLWDYWKTTDPFCKLEDTWLLSQMASQFCVVQSSFIFSKVAYGSSNQCLSIVNVFVAVDNMDNREFKETFLSPNDQMEIILKSLFQTYLKISDDVDEDEKGVVAKAKAALSTYAKRKDIRQARLYVLQVIDHLVLRRIRTSLEPYGTWFSLHWVLYSLSFFVSLAALADTFSLLFYNADKWYELPRNDIDLAWSLLLTLEHTFLFMYPCFRAVQVTASRDRLITKVSKQNWTNMNMHEKMNLVDYMRTQNFGFRISLFCADITFGFNLAFLSVFIGVFGAILKLAI